MSFSLFSTLFSWNDTQLSSLWELVTTTYFRGLCNSEFMLIIKSANYRIFVFVESCRLFWWMLKAKSCICLNWVLNLSKLVSFNHLIVILIAPTILHILCFRNFCQTSGKIFKRFHLDCKYKQRSRNI